MSNKLKVQDLHAEGISEKFDELTELDLKRLIAKSDRFIDSGCPSCHGLNVQNSIMHQGLNYRRCLNCEMLYISPAPTEEMHLEYVLTSSAMSFWRENMPAKMKQSRRPMYKERVEYYLRVMKDLKLNPKTSFEIGAGNGEFAEELAESTDLKEIVILEPQDLNLNKTGIEIVHGGFEKMENINRKFDVVFVWEVIEHILEPDHFLKLIRNVLNPGAPLIISTPNEKSVETRSLGKDSSNILFDHVRLYNPKAISELFKRNGFKILNISTPGQLDVERLLNMIKKNPDYFKTHPTLDFILKQNEPLLEEFQNYLVQNLQSSHMRVVAVVDGEWRGSRTPTLDQK